MKITADKKYFIFENQFDKLPAEIIDYICFFVDNFVPNDKHKKFINNDLLCFINSSKVLKDYFYNVRFLLNDIIMIDYIQQYNYLFITDENYLKFFEKKEYLKNNMIIIGDNIHNYYYYLKNYNDITKKTTVKKLNKSLNDKNNKKIFEMIEHNKLINYLYIHTGVRI